MHISGTLFVNINTLVDIRRVGVGVHVKAPLVVGDDGQDAEDRMSKNEVER